MLKLSIHLVLVFLFNFNSWGQLILIKGAVKDIHTKEGLTAVSIGFGAFGTISDRDGNFQLNVDTSVHFLHFRLIGYEDTTVQLPINHEINVFLTQASYLLNTPVITSSRFEKPLAESSVSLSVIKPEFPSKLNCNTVAQVLDRVPGVQIIDGQANIRGGSGYSYGAGSRVLLMMDELPVLVADSGFPNWDDLPLENIGQIEIVKGASSALYGGAAMNGIIHFRTAYPGSDPYTNITLGSRFYLKPSSSKEWWGKNGDGSVPNETFINFVRREKINTLDYAVSGQYSYKLGYNKNEDYKKGRVHFLIRKRVNDRLKLNLGLNYNQGRSSSFFYWKDNGSFEGDPTTSSTTQKLRFTIDPSLTYDSESGFQHKLLSRYYYVENNNENNQSNRSNNVYSEYQLSRNFQTISLQCAGGIVLNQSWTNAELYGDTSFNHRNLAAFIQLEKKIADRLIISGGFRYENYRIKGPHFAGGKTVDPNVSQDTTLFRFGANLKLAKSSFLRASFGQGFRFPTIAEKYISTKAGGLSVVPNPDLHAEYGISYEIGIKQAAQFNNTRLLADLAIFESRYHEMMEFLLNNRAQFQSINIGDTDIKGFEIEVQTITEFRNCTLTTNGGYTYIDPRYLEFDKTPITNFETASRGQLNAATSSSEENILKYRSKYLIRYDIQLEFSKFFFGLNFNYASNVAAIDKVFDLFIKGERDYRLSHNTGYRLYDFRVGLNLKHFGLQINFNNAFNEDYSQRPGLMAAPRNVAARISYKL